MKLEFVQQAEGSGGLGLGLCEKDDCRSRAVGCWQDETKDGFWLCEAHRIEMGAPPVTEGVAYAPSRILMSGYMWHGAKAVKVGRQ